MGDRGICLFQGFWFPAAMEDGALFHQLLSNTALALSRRHPSNPNYVTDSETHHAIALRVIHRYLHSVNYDTVVRLIGSVAGLAAHAILTQDSPAWEIHMRALAKILHLLKTGTLDCLPEKLRMIIFFVDVTGSVRQDTMPYFPAPDSMLNAHSTYCPMVNDLEKMGSNSSTIFDSLSRTQRGLGLCQVLHEMNHFASLIDSEANSSKNPWSDPTLGGMIMMPYLHRLLCLKVPQTNFEMFEQGFDELARLSMMIILAQYRRRLAGFRIYSQTQSALVFAILSRPIIQHGLRTCDRALGMFFVWALLATLPETTCKDHKLWLSREFEALVQRLKLMNWNAIENFLCKEMVWSRSVHSDPARVFWQDAVGQNFSADERGLATVVQKMPAWNDT